MPTDDIPLLAVERKRIILEILEREGAVRTAELKEILHVSLATIRSDLRELESTGVCESIWGGAVSKRRLSGDGDLFFGERSQLNSDAKRRIGAQAIEQVKMGQTIFVDAGTTTVELVQHLPRDWDYLRVVTSALNVATVAAQFPYIELVMTGGVLRHLTRSLIGPQTLRSLESFNADCVFLATGGFSLKHGVTTSNILEVEVKRAMVEHSSKVVLMTDSSKFGKVLPLTVLALTEVDVLITDQSLSDADTRAIEALNVEVYRV